VELKPFCKMFGKNGYSENFTIIYTKYVRVAKTKGLFEMRKNSRFYVFFEIKLIYVKFLHDLCGIPTL
jgi:hypothetical protein